MQTLISLTDHEVHAHKYGYNLADGHAYQDLFPPFVNVVDSLEELWRQCEVTRLPELENRFRAAFSDLACSQGMASFPDFKVCLTASQSIDIIGAVLAEKGLITELVEPTFDNLALLLKRRRVKLQPLEEVAFFQAAVSSDLPAFLAHRSGGALFLVQPNNPTGRTLDADVLYTIANYCAQHKKMLIIDNSFRFYNREPYDDYSILTHSGVSFIAFEDTGKVWPTHELKASLLFCSPDLQPMITAIHNEFQIGHSRFSLAILEQFILCTISSGLSQTIWSIVDQRRAILRKEIENTGLEVDETSIESHIPVEWLNIQHTNYSDIEVTNYLETRDIHILPGRHFFWDSSTLPYRQKNIRIALMKPSADFKTAMDILRTLQFKTDKQVQGLTL